MDSSESLPYTPLEIRNTKQRGKKVIFSLPVMNCFRKMQHTVLVIKRGKYYYPYMAMLGCDKTGIIKGVITLVTGTKGVSGCCYAAQLKEEVLTKAVTKLIKRGLSPCGIFRVLNRGEKDKQLNFSPVGSSFRDLFLGTGWYSVTVGNDAMVIETYKKIPQGYKPILLGWDILMGGTK